MAPSCSASRWTARGAMLRLPGRGSCTSRCFPTSSRRATCRAHPIVLALVERLGARLRFVFRNFPLGEMHPRALHAAEAAESVAAHAGDDAYWKMHHAIYEHQQDSDDALDDAHLVRYAKSAGADAAQVMQDLENDAFEERVK